MNSAEQSGQRRCEDCGGSGMVIPEFGERVVYRCPCPAGERFAGPQYVSSDKNKLRPFTMPVWGEAARATEHRLSGREKAVKED